MSRSPTPRRKPVSGRLVVLVFIGMFLATGAVILWAIARVAGKA